MNFQNQLTLLAQKDPALRRAAMEQALQDAGLPYTVQTAPDSKRLSPEQNYLVKTGDAQTPSLLFCAHYDAMPGSAGANDNAAAVCILLALAREFQVRGKTAEFAFFDAEEDKRAGSRLYVSELLKGSVTGVINLDLCGYGDTIVLMDRGRLKKNALRPFAEKTLLQKHEAQIVKFLPESDDVSFRGKQIPTLSMAIVPRWDVQYLNTLSTFGGGGVFGRTPEFEMIFEQMEICTTIHGAYRDTVNDVQDEAMERVYRFLLEGCALA